MASLPTETRQWQLACHPVTYPKLEGSDATFEIAKVPLPALNAGEVLLQTIFISNDPAARVWITGGNAKPREYVPPVKIGDKMRARSLSRVMDSKAQKLPVGTVVLAAGGWAEYFTAHEDQCIVIPQDSDYDLPHYLGILGVTGLTAYYGLVEITTTTRDDVVVISGAAGATGSTAVQVAKKIIGCKKVIGIAGTDEKCRFVEALGADICLNYKSPTFYEDLSKATEDLADVFFDNVGGDILDFMFTRLRQGGRVALCGSVSRYNNLSEKASFAHFDNVITQRLKINGFVVLDYLKKLPDVIQIFQEAAKEGKLRVDDGSQTLVPAKFEEIPEVWLRLFEGKNQGKLVTKLLL
uniref:Dehydrogenase FUB6 n=1 Tax=Bionectria ochroleuca TaxID=29856 RepID=A0A8H7K2P8_BIOOC